MKRRGFLKYASAALVAALAAPRTLLGKARGRVIGGRIDIDLTVSREATDLAKVERRILLFEDFGVEVPLNSIWWTEVN